jgi:hypothetical protein
MRLLYSATFCVLYLVSSQATPPGAHHDVSTFRTSAA